MKFEIGDLVLLHNSMIKMNYPEYGTVISKKGGRYFVAFPTGLVQVFHPRWLIKGDKNEKEE